ncbi:unnamed protein product [Rotaria socialis]|uniref:RNase H type-1 domain-containing protein n=1 Tax=Rotaria socialis TaxID=392032 RepID=A0A818FA21_9BILA|nr:unnamed protein product [Rotaria socialis]CAF4634761.1 unnamed protein product [Rotaria socialis]
MGNALIIVSDDVCEDGCAFTIGWVMFGIIFMLIVISICSIYHVICSIYHVICSIYHVICSIYHVICSIYHVICSIYHVICSIYHVICSIYHGFCSISDVDRQKQPEIATNENKKELSQCEDTTGNLYDAISVHFPLIVTIEKIPILHNVGLFSSPTSRTSCVVSVDIYAISTVEINKSIAQVFPSPSIKERELICYCDGSYSHYKQIGHSGFRASDGEHRVRRYYPCHPKNGSTETEVLAAFLAIQYALEKHYNTLIIYTDNSKVEQLLTRPKKKDNINYPQFGQIINQYKNNKINNHVIKVVRVRGHTSRYEQKKCKTNYEFAKIDQTVRKKTRQCKARWWGRSGGIYYYYWYEPLRYS